MYFQMAHLALDNQLEGLAGCKTICSGLSIT